MQLKKWINLLSILGVILYSTTGCSMDDNIPTENVNGDNIITLDRVTDSEKILEDLASILPIVMNDSNLTKITYNEAHQREDIEPYVLWSKIADIPTKNGNTIRKEIEEIKLERNITDISTAYFDSLKFLQIYFHGFDLWNGTSPILSSYTPLTIDDIKVTELTLYDSLGNSSILHVDTLGPAYPIAIIGINEELSMRYELEQTYSYTGYNRTSNPAIKIKKLNLDWSANNYEPWFMGLSEIYFVNYFPNFSGSSTIRVGRYCQLA